MRGLRRRLADNAVRPEPVEYIHADKRQMIQTDWVPGIDPKIELDWRIDSIVQEGGLKNTLFGVNEVDRNVVFAANFGGEPQQHVQIYLWNDKAYESGGVIHMYTYNVIDAANRWQLSMDKTQAVAHFINIYGTSYSNTVSLQTRTAANTKPIALLASNGTAALTRCDVWLYGVKCWNGGVLERDYVPARKSGVYGLWDKVEGKFLTSTTGVDFLGPE